MRLVLVTNDYPPKPGGIQQYLGSLVRHLPAPVLVVAPSDESAGDEEGVLRLGGRFLWPTPRVRDGIVAAARDFRADAILFGAPHPLPVLGATLRRRLDVPFAVIAHGAEVTLPSAAPGLRHGLAAVLRSADLRLAVSRYTQRAVERLTGRAVAYLGGGVDVDAYRPADREPNAVPIVGCVGRFVPRKGQDMLIEAVHRLGRHLEVLLVGRGRTEVELRRLAAERGVRARFEVDVPWDRLPGLYREMDVFCMPCRSRWGGLEVEGLGLVFLEAAATALPVLAGDSGGAAETVLPGESGFLVRDVDDIVDGLRLLLDDPQRGSEMGVAGRQHVESGFTWPKVADRLTRELEGIL